MFGLLTGLAKATVIAVVETPLAVIADAAPLGGVLTDKDEPYTATAISKLVDTVDKATSE